MGGAALRCTLPLPTPRRVQAAACPSALVSQRCISPTQAACLPIVMPSAAAAAAVLLSVCNTHTAPLRGEELLGRAASTLWSAPLRALEARLGAPVHRLMRAAMRRAGPWRALVCAPDARGRTPLHEAVSVRFATATLVHRLAPAPPSRAAHTLPDPHAATADGQHGGSAAVAAARRRQARQGCRRVGIASPSPAPATAPLIPLDCLPRTDLHRWMWPPTAPCAACCWSGRRRLRGHATGCPVPARRMTMAVAMLAVLLLLLLFPTAPAALLVVVAAPASTAAAWVSTAAKARTPMQAVTAVPSTTNGPCNCWYASQRALADVACNDSMRRWRVGGLRPGCGSRAGCSPPHRTASSC